MERYNSFNLKEKSIMEIHNSFSLNGIIIW
ncbi:hypothetical protein HMPREF9140_00144 [Prevotella micans F0438]|uniref:Uncharacterized protein n=1 Tax=Prevotella micans F0438 TaxID=883158 RepID=H1PZQ6_9BACT|nr:hypothetical protein HMPREF9140_00144 [Prevotella micans F0438]